MVKINNLTSYKRFHCIDVAEILFKNKGSNDNKLDNSDFYPMVQ